MPRTRAAAKPDSNIPSTLRLLRYLNPPGTVGLRRGEVVLRRLSVFVLMFSQYQIISSRSTAFSNENTSASDNTRARSSCLMFWYSGLFCTSWSTPIPSFASFARFKHLGGRRFAKVVGVQGALRRLHRAVDITVRIPSANIAWCPLTPFAMGSRKTSVGRVRSFRSRV